MTIIMIKLHYIPNDFVALPFFTYLFYGAVLFWDDLPPKVYLSLILCSLLLFMDYIY